MLIYRAFLLFNLVPNLSCLVARVKSGMRLWIFLVTSRRTVWYKSAETSFERNTGSNNDSAPLGFPPKFCHEIFKPPSLDEQRCESQMNVARLTPQALSLPLVSAHSLVTDVWIFTSNASPHTWKKRKKKKRRKDEKKKTRKREKIETSEKKKTKKEKKRNEDICIWMICSSMSQPSIPHKYLRELLCKIGK